MRKQSWLFPFVLLLAVILYFQISRVQLPGDGFSTFGSDTVRAEVIQIIEEGEVDLGGHTQKYQIARVNILEGEYEGIPMEIDYGKRQLRSDDYDLVVGGRVMVSISKTPDNVVNAYFVDFVRTSPLLWLTVIFAAAIILISRWKGVRALLSMAFSLYVIIDQIIPHILNGDDPLWVSIIGSIVLLSVTLYLTYGWNLKTHASVLSMVLVLLLTGALSAVFVIFTKLNGTGDENVMFLMQMMEKPLNLRGLLLGGMIIGALGVLDDLVTTQSAAVFELHHANPSFKFRDLYNSAMRIGQDHVAATVNTLVLAYAGASLPMLLMFSLGHGNYGYIINFSFIAEEVVRTLVGSLGLIAAVPLTTAIAILFAQRAELLGRWEQVLGPEGSGDGHGHAH
ncbi:MAG TPA: YibE/F family protein [Anaerolineales bacterium]|nr:YibE/F family protein [Anaerolineales bacterium]HMV95906.1 YibE/F family protein [Anaerolineales bacterium]HMX18969.1 YibE/F family protein [Anaerolineales bacterium]HMX74374.1 YibE/F family protein [Anaerolineales bacterium]HMZ42601.1 YibE/F family protein [Anaerolineales bacterium]